MATLKIKFGHLVHLSDLTNGPREFEFTASDSDRKNLAERFDLRDIVDLQAYARLSLVDSKGTDGPIVEATGTLNAGLMQTCVVSLEAVENRVDSTFDGQFCTTIPDFDPDEEDVDLESEPDDILGEITDGAIDLTALFAEQLALEIDPFPRKEGISFDDISVGGDDEDDVVPKNPFAVLAKLKDNPD